MNVQQSSRPSAEVMLVIDRLSDSLTQERRPDLERRDKERHPLQLSCAVHFFVEGTNKTASVRGCTRNVSSRGIGIVVKRCFHQDDPIEVCIKLPGRDTLYMAGLVRFCRYITEGYFEVGVELMSAGNAPIFSADPVGAARQLCWLPGALRR